MSFLNSQYIIYVLISFALITFLTLKIEKSFFSWVKNFWFYKRSFYSKFSTALYLGGIFLLLLSILDLRGPQKSEEGNVSELKTLILLDSSLSMLVEDVRPNRFQKAIFMARHFIKRAAGHKISIVLFSDNTKRLVPFTGDKELLDARISGLIDKGVSGGGSNITKSIKEAEKYFTINGDDVQGNILVFTDGESHRDIKDFKVKNGLNLGVVGIGTEVGGNVPLAQSGPLASRFKKFGGKNVNSKLDVKFLEELGKNTGYYKYWLASTYSLPTEEILSFFEKSNTLRTSKENVMTRPVYAHVLIIPALTFLIIAFGLKNFTPAFLTLLFVSSFSNISKGQVTDIDPKELERQKYLEEAQIYLDKWKKKDLNHNEKMSLASKLLQADEMDRAATIYKNNLESVDRENVQDYFNWATGDLKQKKFGSALKKLDDLNKYLEQDRNSNQELREKVRKNLLYALKKMKSNKSGKGKGKDKDKSKGKKGDPNQKLSGEKRMKELDKKNVSGVLKQILDEDRNLQKRYLDTSTKDKKKANGMFSKDW